MNSHSYEHSKPETCEATVVDAKAVARIRATLEREGHVDAVVSLFAAFADTTRLTILSALLHNELCVCDLAQVAGVSQSGASHQLRVLRDLDLVTFRRDGKRAVYRLADDHVASLIVAATEHVSEPPREQQ